ncbi:hypothetical protein D3C77_651500 [compost metagenome]
MQLKTLALTIFIIDGDSFDSDRFYGFNAVQLAHPVMFSQQSVAVFTAIDQGLRAVDVTQMTITTLAADQRRDSSKLAVAGDMIGRSHIKLGAYHTIHAPLVID